MWNSDYEFRVRQATALNTAFRPILQPLVDNPRYEGTSQPVKKIRC